MTSFPPQPTPFHYPANLYRPRPPLEPLGPLEPTDRNFYTLNRLRAVQKWVTLVVTVGRFGAIDEVLRRVGGSRQSTKPVFMVCKWKKKQSKASD